MATAADSMPAEGTRGAKPVTAWRYYLPVFGSWCVATLASLALVLTLQVRDAEERLSQRSSLAFASLQERVQANDVVLEGFAAALRSLPPMDDSRVRDYARAMLARYPHIEKFGISPRILGSRRATFEAQMRAMGYADYEVLTFDYDGDRRWRPAPQAEVHYPVAFLEPMTADALSGLGLDLIAEPHLAAALALALERNATAATVPFDLSDGARGYLLFRPVCASHQESCSGEAAEAKPRLVAGLAVRANALIDCDPDIPSDFTCALYYDQTDGGEKRPLLELQSAYRATALERLLFPRVERDRRIDSVSQPLMLAVSEQLGFRSFDLSMAAAVVAVSLMGLALILAAVRSQVRSDRERGRAQQALTEERRGLEQRVQERTQALFQLNAELSQENEARRTAERRLALNERQARGLARRVLDIQEQERRALARELHDDIGQSLTAIRTHARLIREQALDPNSATARSAEAIGAVAANLYDRAHRLMRRLRPRALDDAGLAAAIESCVAAAEIEPLGIRVHLRLERDLDGLDEAVNITLYRVLQEALTNVARHSGAHNVYIRLTRTDPVDLGQGGQAGAEITLEVQDDGRGLAEAAAGTGFGLMGLRERVDSLGGIFELDTAPGGGLTLRVRVPLTSGG